MVYSRNLIKSNNANLIEIGAYTSLISGVQILAGSSAVDGYIKFDTKANERMRIIGNGNVGIGTTSPVAKLEINGGTGVATAGAFILRQPVTVLQMECLLLVHIQRLLEYIKM